VRYFKIEAFLCFKKKDVRVENVYSIFDNVQFFFYVLVELTIYDSKRNECSFEGITRLIKIGMLVLSLNFLDLSPLQDGNNSIGSSKFSLQTKIKLRSHEPQIHYTIQLQKIPHSRIQHGI